jgi:RNA polymerase sigma-70 factor, ECF subfamily
VRAPRHATQPLKGSRLLGEDCSPLFSILPKGSMGPMAQGGEQAGHKARPRVHAVSARTADQLTRMSQGDAAARNEVFRKLYEHLHRIASCVRRKNRGGELETTELIGEAYERLSRAPEEGWKDREHFLARAAIAMRQVLIDHVRAHGALKRGGGHGREPATALDQLAARLEERTGGLLRFEAGLSLLREEDPEVAQVVDLRLYGGLSVKDVALVLNRPLRRVEREISFAKHWLGEALR